MMIRARTPRTRAAVCACPTRPSVNSYVLSRIELHLPEQCDGIETDDTNLGFSIIAVQCKKSIVIESQWTKFRIYPLGWLRIGTGLGRCERFRRMRFR